MPSASILVIEDDPRSARMLSASLTADGYRIVFATSGEQLPQLVDQETPDLIICDVLLPGIDGIELTRVLRAQAATESIPLLLVTSLDDRKVISRGLEAAQTIFSSSPFTRLSCAAAFVHSCAIGR